MANVMRELVEAWKGGCGNFRVMEVLNIPAARALLRSDVCKACRFHESSHRPRRLRSPHLLKPSLPSRRVLFVFASNVVVASYLLAAALVIGRTNIIATMAKARINAKARSSRTVQRRTVSTVCSFSGSS